MAEMSPLRRRMIEDMTVRNLSPATQRCYVSRGGEVQPAFRLLAGPARAGGGQSLPSPSGRWRDLLAGAEPDRLRAAVLLWRDARLRDDTLSHASFRSCLSADEVVSFLEAVPSLKSRAALTTAYAAGLRTSEVVGLRVEDVDSARGVIAVRCGKGGKDHHVMLSRQLLGILRTYWRIPRPPRYLFPGRDDDQPSPTTPVATATVPSARPPARAAGSAPARASFCPCLTIMSSSPFRAGRRARLPNPAAGYDVLFEAAAPALTMWAPIRVGWAPSSASWWCCTPGGRHSAIIRTFTVLSRAADCRWTQRVGCTARLTSSSP